MKCPNCQSELVENAQFCISCGHPVVPPPPPPVQATHPQHGTGIPLPGQTGRRSLPNLTMIAAVVAICLLAVVVVAVVAIPAYVNRSQTILYAVHDSGPGTSPNAIVAIRPDGSDYREIAHSRSGFWLPASQYAAQTFLSPDYSRLILYDRVDQAGTRWEMVLYNIQSTAPELVERDALRPGTSSVPWNVFGFSADGRRFAYTTYDERRNEVALYVVDEGGLELFSLPSAIFVSFFPDNRRILYIQATDDRLQDALAWVDIQSGEQGRIVRLSESSIRMQPLLSPDSQQVYFYADDELLVVDTAGGAARRLYDFESQRSAVFFTPGHQFLAVYDQISNSDAIGELRLINLADNRSVRIDRDVNLLSRGNYHVGEAMIDVSADDSLVAYLSDIPGNQALYVAGSDGRNRRLISRGNAWLTFAFSPDGRRIAYIEGRAANEPGSLYVANVDGSDRLRLDVDVWSFRFAPNGRSLAYSKVSGLNRTRPESELYTIRPDGEQRELILESQRGLIGLLAWTR